MTANSKVIKTVNNTGRNKALFVGFSVWALILLFLGFNYISEGYHSAVTDAVVLGLGVTFTALAAVFFRKAKDS